MNEGEPKIKFCLNASHSRPSMNRHWEKGKSTWAIKSKELLDLELSSLWFLMTIYFINLTFDPQVCHIKGI